MLEGEMDTHLGYEKNSVAGITPATPVMAVIRRKSKPNMESPSFHPT